MNRNTYLLFLKSIFAFLFLLLATHSFGGTFYAMGNDALFSSTSSWNSEADGSGLPPGIGFTTIGENFIIEGNKTINVTSNLNIGGLTLNSGATLKIIATTDVTITMDSLVINKSGGLATSIIDCGSNNVILIILGNLRGEAFSEIKHNPSTGKTQRIILRGGTNKLYKFSLPTTIPGTSIVRYEGATQDVFNAGPYSYLELSGGTKKLLAASNGAVGEATAKDGLIIATGKLQLGTLNFTYSGIESNLKCTTGWVYTDLAGTYSSDNEATRTFPVGTASKMQALKLTNNISGKKISVRFGTPTNVVPNSGIGAWYITTPSTTPTTITLINQSSLTSANIALYNNTSGVWVITPTTFISPSYSTSANISLSGTTVIGLFTCPTLTATPSSLPDAIVGNTYNQSLTLSGGTSPYTQPTKSSTPSGVFSFTTQPTKIIIDGNPTAVQPVSLSFVIQDATGCQSPPISYTINSIATSTTWDGSSWSYGPPTSSMRAIIAATYSTNLNGGNITAKHIIIQSGKILNIDYGNAISATDSIKNLGTINKACGGSVAYAEFEGNTIVDLSPVISPVNLPAGITGQPYSQAFTVTGVTNPTLTLTNSAVPDALPTTSSGGNTAYIFNTTTNTLTFTQGTAKNIKFNLTYTNGLCVVKQAQQIKIVDLPSPNLTILNIGAKTFGDRPFKVRTYSRSTETITYAITSSPSCATINTSTGEISINCAGPSPQHIVTVRATQAATPAGSAIPYKAETTTETFVIKPAAGRFIVLNNAFLVNQSKAIGVFTKLDENPTLSFDQLTGFSNVVQPDGTVIASQVGAFSVRISMAATNNYTAFDSTYTFNVITQQIPPVAVADTIVLEMGKDSTFNILDNDLGMTAEIAPNKTDIDIENNGMQVKFYATELGNFLIDPEGNLTILPFNGFIGSGKLGYTVADVNGLRSEITYVEVIVNPPYVVPELKANTLMTPNNDNLNDALVIANTDLSKENSLIIIDQTGNTVYETTNYQNNWEGIDNKNNKLEPGVYFYVFKEKTSGREMKNYIQIVK